MKQSLLLEFPVAEYEARIKRLREELTGAGMDAILLTMPSNVRYFSGLRSIVWVSNVSMPGVVLITANGTMRVVGSASNNPTARATSCAEDDWFYTYRAGTDVPTFIAALKLAIHDLGLEKARMGMEFGEGFRMRMTMADYNALCAAFPAMQLKDAAQLLWNLRSVKSPLEQERLRECARINSKVFDEAFHKIVPGVSTEEEIYQFMAAECFRMGAESMLQLDVRGDKQRYGQGNCPPSWMKISAEEGTTVLIDGGPCIKGYYSDIIRVGVIGKPSARQQEMFEIAREGNQAGLDALKPGVTVEEVCKKVDAYFAGSRAAESYRSKGWIGHCVGLDVHEFPCLTLGDSTVVKPGMVFAVEPVVGDRELGAFCIEENVLVTENGAELLSNAPRELYRVG